MEKKKNDCLNFMKGISCLAIVLGHCELPVPFNKYMMYISKFAVPVFFMISGYFVYYEQEEMIEQKLPKKMIHILKLTIMAEILYGIVFLLKAKFLGNPIDLQLNRKEVLTKILVGSFFNGALWFLNALFWSYVCFYVIHKFRLYEICYKLTPIVLMFHVMIRTYVKKFEWYDVRMFRNFLLFGLPFMIVGNYVHRNKEKLCEKLTNKGWIAGVFLGMGLTVLEYLVSRQSIDFYFGTIIMSGSMFMYAIKNPTNKVNSILCNIGEQLSMYIYILHMLVIEISATIGNYLNIKFYEWINPINVIVISVFLAYLCGKWKLYWKNGKLRNVEKGC